MLERQRRTERICKLSVPILRKVCKLRIYSIWWHTEQRICKMEQGKQEAKRCLTLIVCHVNMEINAQHSTSCGMWMPFARYRRWHGINARKITDFCPNCGKKMTSMPMCGSCAYWNGEWKDDGICFACREQVWIPGKPHRQVGNEKSHTNCAKMDEGADNG